MTNESAQLNVLIIERIRSWPKLKLLRKASRNRSR